MATTGVGAWQSMSADPNCVCEGGFGEVTSIVKSPLFYGAGMGVLPGLSHQDTAILAGVLTGLATFLFLAIPILCCLCPFPCLCCGGAGGKSSKAMAAAAAGGAAKRKEKHMHDGISGRSTDVESIMSFRSFDKNWDKLDKVDYDNLYEVDMKLPRVWLETLRGVPEDQIDGRLQELEATNWQGADMYRGDGRHGAFDEGGNMQTLERNMTMETSGGYGTGGGNGHIYSTSTSGRDGGQVLEWETTRQINIAASELPEQEYIYEREFRQEMNGMERDNFMKIYQTYRRMLDDSKQTAF
ncbi:uncharacterized protein [Argopecten irradians]|uniref:uncharacterized protein n=1 Tax=Argopecten irradians TaxID=31199 RepID=UPI00371431D8